MQKFTPYNELQGLLLISHFHTFAIFCRFLKKLSTKAYRLPAINDEDSLYI